MRPSALFAIAALGSRSHLPALAQKKYDPGANDKEIKIGNTMPYSGPASAYGTIGKAEAAYFKMINDQGGINGRKINCISLDDGYSPPQDRWRWRASWSSRTKVLFVFQTLGTPSNTAIHKYMNTKKVPQLFVATGATKWNDPKNFPWTMGWQPNYQTEGALRAAHPAEQAEREDRRPVPERRLRQGLPEGLQGRAGRQGQDHDRQGGLLRSDRSDRRLADRQLQASGADTFFNITTPKFAAQAIRKWPDIGWKPVHYLNQVSASVGSVLKPAGLDKSVGLISTEYFKDPTDPLFANDPGMKEWQAFMKKY